MMTFQVETLESVIAPGKGSWAYNAGYYTGKAVRIALDVIDWD
ncbi:MULTISPECIES: hypothetical protein [Bacillus cereus group]|nr:hypothetical protein [Bacillus cereus]MDF9530902.1 hypothetical protein [Bacillus cereus]MDG1579280.1 hypothetical protein [Bacillus cereus]